MLAKASPRPNIRVPMALSRLFPALVALCCVIGDASAADEPALTLAEVIARARTAVTADAKALDAVKALRLEFTSVDHQADAKSKVTLTLAAPGFRHQSSEDDASGAVSVVCAGALEGWAARLRNPLEARELRPVPYEEFRRLRDMARDDLAFFAVPPAELGSAEYQGLAEVDGRRTHAVTYAYASGFRITRHFDARTFALVASDQLSPGRRVLRQKVESFLVTGGLRLAAKETVHIDGRKVGEVTYERVTVNPTMPADLFRFPTF
jgi:hypothetical protein